MHLEQSIRQDQRLVMNAAMEQAFHILMMPTLELSEWLELEIEKNPLLKLTKSTSYNDLSTSIPSSPTLYEHLLHEIELHFTIREEKEVARIFAGSLDDKGFITLSEEELEGKEAILEKFQQMNPLGIGARNPQEALLIQLHDKKGSLAYALVSDFYPDLLRSRLGKIAKAFHVSEKKIQEIIQKKIRPLNPFPGAAFYQESNPVLSSDLVFEKEGETWKVEVQSSHLPKIEVDETYLNLLKKEESEWLRRYLAGSNWLKRSVTRRQSILYAIGTYLLKRQRKFLEGIASSPSPMTMKEMAKDLELSESTVTRALSRKGASTPRGLIPLRDFFTYSIKSDQGMISNQEAKMLILQLIKHESAPLSDNALSKKLKERGIQCERRTVAKYRKELNIGTASERRLK